MGRSMESPAGAPSSRAIPTRSGSISLIIEACLTEHFEAGPIEYRWVNEDYTPMDGAPFIGWSSSMMDGYLVATGFKAWGITNGTAAGRRPRHGDGEPLGRVIRRDAGQASCGSRGVHQGKCLGGDSSRHRLSVAQAGFTR
jgi:hypothetical protein